MRLPAHVPVPEAAVDEYGHPVEGKYQIGPAGKIAAVKAVAKSSRVERSSNE